jgi:hypothetical protein
MGGGIHVTVSEMQPRQSNHRRACPDWRKASLQGRVRESSASME